MKKAPYKKYIRQVKRIYTGKRKIKNLFIHEIEDSIMCYMENNPNAAYQELLEEFGDPTELDANINFNSIKKIRKRNLLLYATFYIVIAIAIIVSLAFTIRYAYFRYEYSKGYYIEQFEEYDSSSQTPGEITIHFD